VTRVAIFPARGGSVRIPRKNIREFMGKPMLQWPIEAAAASDLFDTLVVSTDDQEIAALARQLCCDVHMRPADDGETGTQEIAARVLEWMRLAQGEACVIYPCNPMLTAEDLDIGHACWRHSRRPFAYSVLDSDGSDAGSFYWGGAVAFRDRVPLVDNSLPLYVASQRFIDINTPDDWARAESMFKALHP
jgi:N-acylneuraminate cytidylyltransferase